MMEETSIRYLIEDNEEEEMYNAMEVLAEVLYAVVGEESV